MECITRHPDVMERSRAWGWSDLDLLVDFAAHFLGGRAGAQFPYLECCPLGRVIAEVIAVNPMASVLAPLLFPPPFPRKSEETWILVLFLALPHFRVWWRTSLCLHQSGNPFHLQNSMLL